MHYKKYVLGIFFILLFQLPILVSAQSNPYQAEFSVPWSFKEIFKASDIPLPQSAPNTAVIHAVYSPSVIQIDGTYYMFFGVSIYCTGRYRDSIALAQSTNGFDWNFVRYIIEPNPVHCLGGSDEPYIFQTNDPSVYINPADPNDILVFYTTVRSDRDNFGHIGITRFNRQLVQTYRNDTFLQGSTMLSTGGFSRPTVSWLDYTGPRMYIDSIGYIASIPLTNYNSLDNSTLRNEGVTGIDIDLPNLNAGSLLFLSGGSWAVSKYWNTSWSPSWLFTPLSQQGWDTNGQGSPWLYMTSQCKARVYMAGTILNPSFTLNIGMAWPTDDRTFSFESCKICNTPSAPIHLTPADRSVAKTGQPITLSWTFSDYGNRPLKQQLCVSSNQTSCNLAFVLLPPSVNTYTFTPIADYSYITWNVTVTNACMKTMSSAITSFSTSSVDPITGDANGDGRVNALDFIIWKTNYTKNLTGTVFGDFNANGTINGIDYLFWLLGYQP